MAMALLIIIVALLFIAAGVEQSRARAKPRPLSPDSATDSGDFDDRVELALNDPIEALRRYGVPEDAGRSAEDAINLKGPGDRRPGE